MVLISEQQLINRLAEYGLRPKKFENLIETLKEV